MRPEQVVRPLAREGLQVLIHLLPGASWLTQLDEHVGVEPPALSQVGIELEAAEEHFLSVAEARACIEVPRRGEQLPRGLPVRE